MGTARWRCAATFLCALATHAADFTALTPQGHVSDFAGVVDVATRSELERYCARVREATGAEIAIVTLPSLQGEPVEDVANAMFRKWGIGQKNENNGILLLLSIQDRRSRLEVGYGLEPYLPDGFAGSILREMRPALRQQQYGEALTAAAHTIGDRIAQAKGVQIDNAPRRPRRQRPEPAVPWPMIGGVVLVFLLLMGVGGRHNRRAYGRFPGARFPGGGFLPGYILGSILGRSDYGRHGGGGFGGFDSSDSFGGFGGGDSGGGGASSSW
jgi:uncharacterized protein